MWFSELAYCDADLVLCNSITGNIQSKSFVGDIKQEYRSVWTLHLPNDGYYSIEFVDFDISCTSGTSLIIHKVTRDLENICNLQKPLGYLYSTSNRVLIELYQRTPTDSLIEGFNAIYTFNSYVQLFYKRFPEVYSGQLPMSKLCLAFWGRLPNGH